MGRLFLIDLEGKKFTCKHCHAHLAPFDDIISKSFHGRHGRAYLFDKVVNVTVGEKEERLMSTGNQTGIHTVVDIFCVGCGSLVGWKYEETIEKESKNYIGKFVLDRFQLLGPDGSKYSITQDLITDMTLDTDINRWDIWGRMTRGNRPYHPHAQLPGWL